MFSFLYKVHFIIFIIILLSSCNGGNSSIEKSAKVDLNGNVIRVRDGRSLHSKDWDCYDLQYDRICCPVNWELEKQNNYLFLTQLEDSDSNTFFVVLRHDTVISNLNLDNYLRAVYDQLRNDTIELFKEYILDELVFDDKRSFFGEFTTVIGDSLFLSFVMYTEIQGLVYDMTLKVPLRSREVNRELFQDLLYNYQANGKFIFNDKDELVSTRKIDIAAF